MKFLKKSLMTQLVTYFLLLSVVTVSLVGLIAFLQAREALKQAVFDQLETTATLKEDELNRWVADRREDVLLIAALPEMRDQAGKLLKLEETDPEYQAAYIFLSDYLAGVATRKQDIQEIFILTGKDGQVILSTDQAREGERHTDADYFIQGQWGPSIQSIYLSPVTGKPTMTIATPLLNEVGLQLGGVLVVHLNLERMDKIVLKRAGLGTSGQTYLVDRSNTLVSTERFGEQEFSQGIHSKGIDNAIQGIDGSALYSNYEGVEVIGVYHWIGRWEVALLAEMNQQEAFAPARQLAGMIILVGLISTGALAVGVYLLARQIIRPILAITNTAAQMAAGDLTLTVPVLTEDEIGVLARAFNDMTARVRDLVGSLEERGNELAARTREIEASQRVTFAASERADPDRLLQMVVNLIRDQFHLYHVQVYVVDEEKQTAVLRQSTGYAGRRLLQKRHHIPLDQPALVTRAIHSGEPVLVADVNQTEDWLPNPLLPDTRSELVVPLKVGDEVVGVLDAQDREPGRFVPHVVALFQTMTDQIAFLFENSELVERVTEQTQTLTIFTDQLRSAADIARRLGGILDPEQLLQQVVELIRNRFGFYHVHIYMLDEAAGRLIVRAGSGEVGRVLRERGHSIPLDAPKSLVARTARDRETLLVEDTSLESDFMPNPLLPQTRSSMSVPLVVGDRVLGVLNIQDDQPGRFTETELDTLTSLAGQIATALQNAAYVEEIERAAEELREMDRLKNEFMANMSHELRTPLNSIIGYAELMLMGVSDIDPETLEDVQAIYSNGQHLLTMINDILDMAKIEAGSLVLNLESVQIAPLIDEVSAKAVERLEGKPIEWAVEAEPDLPPIQADPLRIGQIFNNLVTNAEKFTEEGAISLRARAEDSWVCIEIQDTGIGIAESDMDKVFDRFQQVDSSSTRTAGGAGLGLAITRRLVELHGGEIEVQSQPGEGSTFTVRLPVEASK
ncbi:MAG TPA: GAF domain-containing protein [Thermoflexia bacterium]|nr:GAF domain-containing protein [Thermoflexia bacterium]